ncbi:MAG: response regulator [Thomasclavelia sp.]
MNEKAHIVILEEDHLLKDSLINKINNKGNYEVIAAFENGIKCLKYLSEHEVDIFIIDLMLTNIDGVGVINQQEKIILKDLKN